MHSAAVTAVAFAPQSSGRRTVLALGLENGNLELWHVEFWGVGSPHKEQWQVTLCETFVKAHAASISRLAWHPSEWLVVSASADSSVKVFTIKQPTA
jgi:WD40 repeat protein